MPIVEKASMTFALGVFIPSMKPGADSHYTITEQTSPVMFGSEKSELLDNRFTRSEYAGLNPYGLKIWTDRINAFRVIASVDTYELSDAQSAQISRGGGYHLLSLQERAVLSYAYLGLSAKDTAEAMHRSTATVNAHRRAVVGKLACSLTPITIARVIYAHKTIQAMNRLESLSDQGKHHKLSDHIDL